MKFDSICSFAADAADTNTRRHHSLQVRNHNEYLLPVFLCHTTQQTYYRELQFDFQTLQSHFLVCQESFYRTGVVLYR